MLLLNEHKIKNKEEEEAEKNMLSIKNLDTSSND
jgi:hypothetical protein